MCSTISDRLSCKYLIVVVKYFILTSFIKISQSRLTFGLSSGIPDMICMEAKIPLFFPFLWHFSFRNDELKLVHIFLMGFLKDLCINSSEIQILMQLGCLFFMYYCRYSASFVSEKEVPSDQYALGIAGIYHSPFPHAFSSKAC